MFKKVNLLSELQKERERLSQEKLLEEVNTILRKDLRDETLILQNIKGAETGFSINSDYENEKIFSIDEIKNTCIHYKMRFLDSELYRGEIPFEAISKIKEMNRKQHNNTADFKNRKYKIMAPARLFKLADADADPMLFEQLANGKYYLIHKWGTDMKWHRRILAFPLQSFQNLVITLIACAALIALITPNEWIIPTSFMAQNDVFGYWGLHRMTFFFHFLILIGGLTIFLGFSFFLSLSENEWDKKTFN